MTTPETSVLLPPLPGVRSVRFNRNERTIISLRGRTPGDLRLSLHQDMAQHPLALAELPAWIQGRTMGPHLRRAIDVIFHAQRNDRTLTPAPVLDAIGGPVDLDATYRRIHDQWFQHLPLIPVLWARERSGTLRSIRFAAFHRGQQRISVNPRVNQPWVARLWLDFLIFHEICHHAQACRPIPGEPPHSARFRSWERRFPAWEHAVAWEKAHLPRFLSASPHPA